MIRKYDSIGSESSRKEPKKSFIRMEKNQSQQAHLVPNNYHSEYIAHFSPLRTHLSITSTGGVGRRGGRRISDGRHLVLEEALPITLVLGKDLVVDGLGGLVLALSIGHQLTDGLGSLPGLVLVLLSSSIGADDESGEANDGGDTEPHDWGGSFCQVFWVRRRTTQWRSDGTDGNDGDGQECKRIRVLFHFTEPDSLNCKAMLMRIVTRGKGGEADQECVLCLFLARGLLFGAGVGLLVGSLPKFLAEMPCRLADFRRNIHFYRSMNNLLYSLYVLNDRKPL